MLDDPLAEQLILEKESYAAMRKDIETGRTPKPGGEPGWIVKWDPDKKSFKHALVAIVFCGVWLESILHLLVVQRKGLNAWEKVDHKGLAEKLKLLGYSDQSVAALCRRYQDMRREVVHEKAHMKKKTFSLPRKGSKRP